MTSIRSKILIVSDHADFARTAVSHWQTGRSCAEVTLVTSDVPHAIKLSGYELVIVGPLRNRLASAEMLLELDGSTDTAAVCFVRNEADETRVRADYPNVLVIPRREGWIASLLLVSDEALRRSQAVRRAERAERLALVSQAEAALGRYALAMRPGINDALTSILGNADLLISEPRSASNDRSEQLRTLQSMALRLNEIMRRFSALVSEIRAGSMDSDPADFGGENDLLSARILSPIFKN